MQDILELEPPQADQRMKYGAEPLQFADLRLPKSKQPWPVVMNIHGGFWRARYDLAHAGHFCAALTSAGYATFNIEYRRSGDHGGGWPGTFEDVRSAYAYLRQNAPAIGFDRSRMLVIGHSAGGHLALCLAGHEASIERVVSLAGVLDLQRAYELHLSNDAVVEFIGGTPRETSDHYREASPFHLKVNARQVVIVGNKDDVVPPEFTCRYAAEKKRSGELVKLVELPDVGHLELIDPRTEAFKTVLENVHQLLARAGYLSL